MATYTFERYYVPDMSKFIQRFVHVQASHSDLMFKPLIGQKKRFGSARPDNTMEASQRAIVQLLLLSTVPRYLSSVDFDIRSTKFILVDISIHYEKKNSLSY
jgi:hypothetical protein